MANKTYINPETASVWNDTTGPTTLALNNLAAGAGVQGDQLDLGSAARSGWYEWILRVEFATAPVVNEAVLIYAKMSDGTRVDNDDGTTAAALSATDKLKNLKLLGSLVVDEAAASTVEIVKRGYVYLTSRYFQPVVFNNTADNLVATNDLSDFVLQPVPPELQ